MQWKTDKQNHDDRLTVLSLYPNCGGLDVAFNSSEKFRIVRVIECDESAAKTYEANFSGVNVERKDPALACYTLHEADLLIGTPPCPETTTRSNFLTILNAELINNIQQNRFQNNEGVLYSTESSLAARKFNKKTSINKRKRTTSDSVGFSQLQSVDEMTKKASAAAAGEVDLDPDDNLRRNGSIVSRWPIYDQLLPVGYPRWWCSYVYGIASDSSNPNVASPPVSRASIRLKKKGQKTKSSHFKVTNSSTSNSKNSTVSYDADTEIEENTTRNTFVSTRDVIDRTNCVNKACDFDVQSVTKKPDNGCEKDDYEEEEEEQEEEEKEEREKREIPQKTIIGKTKKTKRLARRRKKTSDKVQKPEPSYDDDAIIHFLNTVAIVRPITFIMVLPPKVVENSSFKPLYDCIVQQASVYNYRTESVVLDASEFGVAQIRRRAVIFGCNRQFDSERYKPFDSPGEFFRKHGASCVKKTAGQVLRTLPKPGVAPNIGVCKARVVPVSNPARGLRGSAYAGQIFNGGGRPIDLSQPCNTFSRYIGGNFTPIVDQAHIEKDSIEPWYEKYYRALKEKGAVSLGTNGQVPSRVRRLTVTEAKILTGFDISFRLCGSHSAQFRQIGAACSPPVSASIVKYVEHAMQLFE